MTPVQAISTLFEKTSQPLTKHANVMAAQNAFWKQIGTDTNKRVILTDTIQELLVNDEYRAGVVWRAALCDEMRGKNAKTFSVLATYMQETDSSRSTMLALADNKPAVIAHSLCAHAAYVVGSYVDEKNEPLPLLGGIVGNVLAPMLPDMIDQDYVKGYTSQILRPQP